MGTRAGAPRPIRLTLALCLFLLACSSSASAATGANGIKVGGGRLHPFVQAETRYVLNPGRLPASQKPPGDMVLVARPGLDLSLPSNKLDLQLKGDVEYQHYFGLENERTRNLSAFAGQLGGRLSINPGGGLVVHLSEHFIRDAAPANQVIGERFLHILNVVGLGTEYKPGGGALLLSIGYSFFYDRYDRGQNGLLDPAALDNMRHLPSAKGTWKFLPRTTLFVEAASTVTRFSDGHSFQNVNTNILHTYVGMEGDITPKIRTLVKAGYGDTLIGGAENFRSVIGQVEVGYKATETIQLRAGFVRNVQPVSLFKYYDLIRGYVRYDHLFFGKLQVNANLQYSYYDFATAVAGPSDARNDGNVVGELGVGYQLTDWLTFVLRDRLDVRHSNYESVGTDATGARLNASYVNNSLTFRIDFRY